MPDTDGKLFWWEENALHDLKVGDLVRYKNGNKNPRLFLVVTVSPERTCRSNTVQYAEVIRTTDGRRFSFSSKQLTTNLDCHTERRYENR